MYKYLFNTNSSTPLDEDLKQKIQANLEAKHIGGDFLSWKNEEELLALLQQTKKASSNTLVLIGDQQDFNALIGIGEIIEESIAIGYIPLKPNPIARKLNLKNWHEAVEALAQRRIHETTVFSAGKRYFLESIELRLQPSSSLQPIIVNVDGALSLRLPDCKLRFENLSDDRYLSKNPILFTAHTVETPTTDKKDLLGGLRQKLTLQIEPQKNQLASLHGRVFKIESATSLSDETGRDYKSSLLIGKYTRKLRLVTGRVKSTD